MTECLPAASEDYQRPTYTVADLVRESNERLAPLKGRVLANRERNMYDDSDFYALVWDEENERPVWVEIGSTRGAGGAYQMTVDASPEIWEKARAWKVRELARQREENEKARFANPVVGSEVEVTVGRKHSWKVGVVRWRGVNTFRTYYRNGYNRPESIYNQRLRLETAVGESFYVDADNVRVVGTDRTPGEAAADLQVGGVAGQYCPTNWIR